MRIRTRVTVAAAVPLGLALLLGTGAVAVVYSHGRQREVERTTRTEADVLAGLVQTGQVPRVLPLPGGSTLLAQVLDANGHVLAASPTASLGQALPVMEGVRRSDLAPGVPLRVAVRRLGAITIVVAAPLTDVQRAVHAFEVVLLVVVPLLIMGSSGTVWWVTGLALRPVEALRRAADAPGVEALPVPATDDELARLAGTLNGLLSRLREQLARERGFIADAAHELRTPIASMQLQLDVAPAPWPDLQAEVTRLTDLVETLLSLARAESGTLQPSQVLDLTALADADGPPLLVVGDEAGLRRLLDNLLANAHRHGSTVRVSTHESEGSAILDVEDDGPGIPAADRERVFERWVRLDPARSRDDGGLGLGLALSRAVALAHGGTLDVLNSPLGGARLRLRLPLAPNVRGTWTPPHA